ncbi:hypothetical protein GCM10018790_63990 [Kitasatospora xanthocidica]|uniref:hypothetical protein n=1 Tax=Kitasatospora xanthocidica TaxID=83382 RepID=UPI00167A111F|nr:hypothetical protein [Kitasatospora xanthocidica]GHF77086.1 hypothetical protein GCM10018790_63990 [Kitasatospora xanthocidica]
MARTPRPRPDDEAQLRLTPAEREKLKAVVLDANAYGHARPDLDRLARWAQRLAAMGVETWVPEPVAWEWAEHLVRDWEVMKNAARKERGRLESAGLEVPAPLGYPTRDDVIAAVLTNLSKIPGVKVIALTGRSAVEGLKDQVLLRRPAKTKGEGDKATKTGASDSAWLRDVFDLAEPDEILIVTSDGDVQAACEAWGKPVPNLRSLAQLRSTLFDFKVDDGHARTAIIRYLTERLPIDQTDQDALDIGRISGLEAAYAAKLEDRDDGTASVYGAEVTELVALAGIGVVRVQVDEVPEDAPTNGWVDPTDPGTAHPEIVDAVVFFLATGEATLQQVPQADDLEMRVATIGNVLVRANLTFEFSDGVISEMSADTDAAAMLLERAFDESYEFEEDFMTALAMVPGVTFDEGTLEDHQSFDVPGTDAHIEVSVTRDGEDWTAEIDLWRGQSDDEALRSLDGTIGVECRYNTDSWLGGGRDGFQGPEAFPVGVYGNGLHHGHSIWSLSAWLLQTITWPRFRCSPRRCSRPRRMTNPPTREQTDGCHSTCVHATVSHGRVTTGSEGVVFDGVGVRRGVRQVAGDLCASGLRTVRSCQYVQDVPVPRYSSTGIGCTP